MQNLSKTFSLQLRQVRRAVVGTVFAMVPWWPQAGHV